MSPCNNCAHPCEICIPIADLNRIIGETNYLKDHDYNKGLADVHRLASARLAIEHGDAKLLPPEPLFEILYHANRSSALVRSKWRKKNYVSRVELSPLAIIPFDHVFQEKRATYQRFSEEDIIDALKDVLFDYTAPETPSEQFLTLRDDYVANYMRAPTKIVPVWSYLRQRLRYRFRDQLRSNLGLPKSQFRTPPKAKSDECQKTIDLEHEAKRIDHVSIEDVQKNGGEKYLVDPNAFGGENFPEDGLGNSGYEEVYELLVKLARLNLAAAQELLKLPFNGIADPAIKADRETDAFVVAELHIRKEHSLYLKDLRTPNKAKIATLAKYSNGAYWPERRLRRTIEWGAQASPAFLKSLQELIDEIEHLNRALGDKKRLKPVKKFVAGRDAVFYLLDPARLAIPEAAG